MKKLILIMIILVPLGVKAQDIPIQGRVVSASDSLPLPGASVTVKGTTHGTITDTDGQFQLTVPSGQTLVISYIGYGSQELLMTTSSPTTLTITLKDDYLTLGEVEIYSTGYQEVPAERATGSFEHIDNELFNRSVSTDVISRLEGVTGGLLFDTRLVGAGSAYGDNYRNLRIRGISSINSDANPLIVVDNFPYDGDVNSINPNDIESITVLEDAAAASIWGARAANGVIVITTKKGEYNQPARVSFNSNVTVGEAPDLYYNPNFLPAPDFIGVENDLFDQGYYDADENNSNKPLLSPVVEILIKERDGDITPTEANERLDALRQQDIRKDAEKYLYRNSLKQQYAVNMRGGSDQAQYYVSGGYDKNLSNIVGNQYERITINTSNTFRPIDQLEITAGIALVQSKTENNGIGWGGAASRFPYNSLADDNGSPLPVGQVYRLSYINQAEEDGLLDWQYRPLEEVRLSNDVYKNNEYRINTALKYHILKGLDLNLKYQYQKINDQRLWLRSKDTYYVRDLANRFTQEDGTQIFPLGGVLNIYHNEQLAHSARGQINYHQTINDKHQLAALAGMEVRQVHSTGNSLELFGYDNEVLTYQSQLDYKTIYDVRPNGRSRLPLPSSSLSDLLDRYISYFGNVSYTYDKRYTLSGSARWDASNLFGVKTNQKGVPLWSVGGSWAISNENFYNIPWLTKLKLRSTYGYNGNINKSASAFITSRYLSYNYLVNLQAAEIRSPGNPQLRWEKVGIWNTGIDYGLFKNRIIGSLEYFRKNGTDLLGERTLDPTAGFTSGLLGRNLINYANTVSKGLDIEIHSVNKKGIFSWGSNVLFSYITNRLTKYDAAVTTATIANFGNNTNLKVKEGEPLDGLYAIPWMGLDPDNGDPLVKINDQTTGDYSTYYNALTFDSLVYIGLALPSTFGSIRNDFSWRGIGLSFNITWKAGYYFRRKSIEYSGLIEQWEGHRDFADRWQQPGDEKYTNVPSMPGQVDSYRDLIYNYSEILFERGDNIRLQDISISYDLSKKLISNLPFKTLRVYFYAENLGILWRANKLVLDPDYPSASLIPGRSFSLGLNASF